MAKVKSKTTTADLRDKDRHKFKRTSIGNSSNTKKQFRKTGR
jgi:hypothetical protein